LFCPFQANFNNYCIVPDQKAKQEWRVENIFLIKIGSTIFVMAFETTF
jgi:hypothetical protein